MTKKCKTCGADVPSSASFCQKCGNSEFVAMQDPMPAQNPNYNQNIDPNGFDPSVNYTPPAGQPGFYQQNDPSNGQSWQTFQPGAQAPKKKKKIGPVVGIISVVVLLLAFAAYMASSHLAKNNSGSNFNINSGNEANEQDAPSVAYTKGTFDGVTYTNEWANLTAMLPNGFSDGNESAYASFEDSSTECGLYWASNDMTKAVIVCFEELPSIISYDEEKYLDTLMEQIKDQDEITYIIPDNYAIKTIAGNEYLSAACRYYIDYVDVVQTFYVRKCGNKMITILVTSESEDSNDTLTDIFFKAN